jgi:FecR protein
MMHTTHTIMRWLLTGCLALGFSAGTLAQTAAAQQTAARVAFMQGSAQITKADGRQEAARSGSTLSVGDTLATGAGSNAQLKFTDNGLVALEANSEFKITSYQFNGRQDGSENLVFDFLKGALRTVSGLIGKQNKQAYRMRTPTATVGIRGTAGRITTDPAGTSIATSEGTFVLGNLAGTQFVEVPAGRVGFVGVDGNAPRLVAARPGLGNNTVAQLRDDFEFARQNRVFLSTETDAVGTPVPVVNFGSFVGDGVSPYPNSAGFDYLTVFTFNDAPGSNASLVKVERDGNDVYQIAIKSGDNIATAYRGDATGPRSLNAAISTQADASTYALWGRWSNGVITVPNEFFGTSPDANTPVQVPLEGSQSYHYVLGTPATNIPTGGVFSYSEIGRTAPTAADGTYVGSMQIRYFTADFGNRKVGLGMNVFTPDGKYQVDTTGNQFDASRSEIVMRSSGSGFLGDNVPTTFSGNTAVSNLECISGCSTFVRGNFFGPGGKEAGFQYTIRRVEAGGTLRARVMGVGVVGNPVQAAPNNAVPTPVASPVQSPANGTTP